MAAEKIWWRGDGRRDCKVPFGLFRQRSPYWRGDSLYIFRIITFPKYPDTSSEANLKNSPFQEGMSFIPEDVYFTFGQESALCLIDRKWIMQGIILAEYIIWTAIPFFSFINCIWEAYVMSITNPLFVSQEHRFTGCGLCSWFIPCIFRKRFQAACNGMPGPFHLPLQSHSTFSDPGDWSDQWHRYELPCSLASGCVWPIGVPAKRPLGWRSEVWVL